MTNTIAPIDCNQLDEEQPIALEPHWKRARARYWG